MNAFYRLLVLLLLPATTLSQVINGTVTDSKTNEPLVYVHIGILHQNKGVISKDKGEFGIDVTGSSSEDELHFSMVGYETFKIRIADINNGYLQVKMVPRLYRLQEVVVRSTKLKAPIKLGRSTPTKTTTGHSGSEEFGMGGEWGLRIFMDGKKYRLADAQFHLRFNTIDSALFRINIYSIKDNLPHESILSQEAFVTSYKNKKWIVKNLMYQNIVLENDVIVTLELVRIWFSKSGSNQLFFTHGEGYERGQTYSRNSSFDAWKLNERAPIAMYLTVDEY